MSPEAAVNAGRRPFVTRSVPNTLMSYMRCQSATSARLTGSSPMAPPALLTNSFTSPSSAVGVDGHVAGNRDPADAIGEFGDPFRASCRGHDGEAFGGQSFGRRISDTRRRSGHYRDRSAHVPILPQSVHG